MQTLNARQVPGDQLDQLDAMAAGLPAGSELGAALCEIIRTVRSGAGVVFAPDDEQVSPSAASRMLGMSRTHLYKVMDAGDLPFVRVGRDRRVAVEDLLLFRVQREHARKTLAERFAHAQTSRASLVKSLADEDEGL